jgi:hypothetical protein
MTSSSSRPGGRRLAAVVTLVGAVLVPLMARAQASPNTVEPTQWTLNHYNSDGTVNCSPTMCSPLPDGPFCC